MPQTDPALIGLAAFLLVGAGFVLFRATPLLGRVVAVLALAIAAGAGLAMLGQPGAGRGVAGAAALSSGLKPPGALSAFTSYAVGGITLFLLTAVLLTYAAIGTPTSKKRLLAVIALLAGAGASYATYMSRSDDDVWNAFERLEVAAKKGGRGGAGWSNGNEGGNGQGQRGGNLGGNGVAEGKAAGGDAAEGGNATGAGGRDTRVASLMSDRQIKNDVTLPFADCADCPDLVIIEPGFFRMGAVATDPHALASERPVFTASLPKHYAIGRTEITVGQYAQFVKETGHARPTCGFADPVRDARLPVDCVSWRSAVAYTRWLSARTGKVYRLPTEIEWQYAARGGAATRYALGDEIPAGDAHIEQQRPKRLPVGTYPANGFGMRDVHGSVAEMTGDCWGDTLRRVPADGRRPVTRGDCRGRVLKDAHAGETEVLSRLSARRPIGIDEARMGVGFRIVREF